MEAAELILSSLSNTGGVCWLDDGVEDAEMSRCVTPGAPGAPDPPDQIQPLPGRRTDPPGPTNPPPYNAPAPIASPNAKHGNAARFPCRMHVDCTRLRRRFTGCCPDNLFPEF
jgi:hypothetical protein